MSLDAVLDIASSALTAQSQRLNAVASNLANADSATGPDGQPYHAKQVVFGSALVSAQGATGVRVTGVIQDPSPMREVYDPKNPLADDKGYVTMPNVDVIGEMVNMISASRAYEENVDMMNTAKSLMSKTLTLGQ
ncbi:MAG TPA: flagellar basal body rod protein FlgC [Burkholderiales bacterium]|nr:flagellar basal body rod protein FlgC [Burkholderiales bacterium]